MQLIERYVLYCIVYLLCVIMLTGVDARFEHLRCNGGLLQAASGVHLLL